MASLESETQKSALGVEASGLLEESLAGEKSTWSETLVYSSPVMPQYAVRGDWYAHGARTQQFPRCKLPCTSGTRAVAGGRPIRTARLRHSTALHVSTALHRHRGRRAELS